MRNAQIQRIPLANRISGMQNNWTHQIVCFDQPMNSDQSDFLFCSYFAQVDGIELLLHNVALVMDSWVILEMRGGRGNRHAISMQPTYHVIILLIID